MSPGTVTGAGAASSFGSGTGADTTTGGSPFAPGASSTFGPTPSEDGTTPSRPIEAPAYTIPGFYGSGSTTLLGGQGRLARPRIQYSVNVAVGFDDNPLQAPTDGEDIPAVTQEVVVQQELPEVTVTVQVPTPPPSKALIGRPVRPSTMPREIVVQEAQEEIVEELILSPAIPRRERKPSPVTRGTVGMDVQFASRRQLFTFDFTASSSYYWSRKPDATDFSGNASFIFLRRITPRLQFTANFDAAYLSQPDFARINTPTNTGGGDTINILSKFDLSYRWSPRITTVTSLSGSAVLNLEELRQNEDFTETTLGNEARWLYSPRLTVLAETRYSLINYPEQEMRNSNTLFALVGFEYIFSRRLNTTLRFGQAFRTFESGGDLSTSPYVEGNVVWRYLPRGTISLNTRFGFEEAQDAASEVQSLRLGINVLHLVTPRLSASIGSTIIYSSTTQREDDTADGTTQSTLDVNAGVQYRLTRDVTLTGNVSFTYVSSDTGLNDYYRNRIFLGAEYEF